VYHIHSNTTICYIDHYRSTNDEVGFSFKIDVDATKFAAHHGHHWDVAGCPRKLGAQCHPNSAKNWLFAAQKFQELKGHPTGKPPKGGKKV